MNCVHTRVIIRRNCPWHVIGLTLWIAIRQPNSINAQHEQQWPLNQQLQQWTDRLQICSAMKPPSISSRLLDGVKKKQVNTKTSIKWKIVKLVIKQISRLRTENLADSRTKHFQSCSVQFSSEPYETDNTDSTFRVSTANVGRKIKFGLVSLWWEGESAIGLQPHNFN